MANNYDINYDDKRFTEVEADKKAALKENDKLYGGMVNESDKYYQAQIDASKQWADTQTQLQNEQTEHAVDKIEQQKDQAHKDYLKEQSGAYTDWQKQSNQYGANAEQVAAQGLANTGFSESSQVSMYNTYQNRVATAREAYGRAVLNYDNAIKDAQLQNNSVLAEIAYKALEQQLTLSLEGFQYKNSLLLEQADKKLEIDNTYYTRYQDVLDQMNTENALAEQIRQYNQDYKLQVDQFNEEIRQFNKQYEESVRQFNQEYNLKVKEYKESIRQFDEEIARLKKKDAQEYKLEIQNLELNKKKLQQEQKQWESEMSLKKAQLEEEKRQFNVSRSSSSSSGGGGGYIAPSTPTKTKDKPKGKDNVINNIVNNKTKNKPKQKTQSEPNIDMNSVLNLGYGPISASEVYNLEKQGIVQSYVSGGKIKFRKSPAALKQFKLYQLSK